MVTKTAAWVPVSGEALADMRPFGVLLEANFDVCFRGMTWHEAIANQARRTGYVISDGTAWWPTITPLPLVARLTAWWHRVTA